MQDEADSLPHSWQEHLRRDTKCLHQAGAQFTCGESPPGLLFSLAFQTGGTQAGSKTLPLSISLDAGRGLCSTGTVTCPEPRNRWMEPWPLPTLWEVHQNSGEGMHPRPTGSPHSCQAWRGGEWEGEGDSTAFLVSWTIMPFFCRTPGSHVLVSVFTYPGIPPGAAPWSSGPYLREEDLGALGCQGHRD